jgi:hypothetical protein
MSSEQSSGMAVGTLLTAGKTTARGTKRTTTLPDGEPSKKQNVTVDSDEAVDAKTGIMSAKSAVSLSITDPQEQRQRLKTIEWPLSLLQRQVNQDHTAIVEELRRLKVQFHCVPFQHHCLHGSTLVVLSNGFSRPITGVPAGTHVLSYDMTHNGHVPRPTIALMDQGAQVCMQLLFSDGRVVTCTADHRFMRPDGTWVMARDMQVGSTMQNATEIVAGMEYPTEEAHDPPTGTAATNVPWSLPLSADGLLGYSLNMTNRKEHAIAFAGLLGFLITDGTVSDDRSALYIGHRLDAEWVVRDIQLLTDQTPTITRHRNVLKVSLPLSLRRAMLFTGVSTTPRISTVSSFPAFILSPTCPLVLVQAFLGGLFGGDGTTPSILWHKSGKSGTPVPTQFKEVRFTTSRLGSVWKAQKERTTIELQLLFDRVGISAEHFTTIRSTNAPTSVDAAGRAEVKRLKQLGRKLSVTAELNLKHDASYKIEWNISQAALLAFHECIGFRYCCHKQMRLTAAAAYYRLRACVSRQRQFIQDYFRAHEADTGHPVKGDKLANTELHVVLRRAKAKLAEQEVVHPDVDSWLPCQGRRSSVFSPAQVAGMSVKQAVEAFQIGQFFSKARTRDKYVSTPSAIDDSSTPQAWIRPAAAAAADSLDARRNSETNVGEEQFAENMRRVAGIKRKARDVDADDPLVLDEEVLETAIRDAVTYGVHATATALPTFRVQLIGRRVLSELQPTFDLTVPETRNFLAQGLVVHNCRIDRKRFPNLDKVLFVRSECYPRFAALSLKYCALPKSKSRRYDQPKSPYEVWHSEPDRIIDEAVMSYTRYNKNQPGGFWAASAEDQEAELQWRLDTIPCPHLFPIEVAISVYKAFGITKALDISSGWGDRLLAACTLGIQYYGCDPNTDLRNAYDAIIRDHGTPGKQVVKTACFEMDDQNPVSDMPCVADGSGGYDGILSSCPFWLLERYSDEKTQSIEMYKESDEWTRKFLFKSLFKCNKALTPGANIILHISDIISKDKTQHPDVFYVQKMLTVCCDVLGWQYKGCFGYKRCRDDQYVTKNETLMCQSMFWLQKPLQTKVSF